MGFFINVIFFAHRNIINTYTHGDTQMINTIPFFMMDAVQSTKKNLVNTFVTNNDIKKLLNEFIDAQTEYTKKSYANTIDTGVAIYSVMTNKEFFNNTMKNCFVPFGGKGK
jgi:hypothetical protein